jgi:hypothetical protein
MSRNLGYYVGIDHTNYAMHNVSVWDSVSDVEWRHSPRCLRLRQNSPRSECALSSQF